MKTTKIIFLLMLILGAAQWAQAQVKHGENPLQIEAGHMLELENNGEYFIIDSTLTVGRSIPGNGTLDPTADALMIKLYGYGLGSPDKFMVTNVAPYIQESRNIGVESNVFAGFTAEGELLKVPLRFALTADSTNVNLSLYNGIDTFGTESLNVLDSFFATNEQFLDSLTNIRFDLQESINNDKDSITENELIEDITVQDASSQSWNTGEDLVNMTIVITEDLGPRDHVTTFDLTQILLSKDQTRIEIGDTADVLRDNIFYLSDGAMTSDRYVDGAGHSIRFNGTDSLLFESASTTITSTSGNTIIDNTTSGGTTEISSDSDVDIISDNGDVNLMSTTDDVTLMAQDSAIIKSTTGQVTLNATNGTQDGNIVLNGDSIRLPQFPANYSSTLNYRGVLGFDDNGNLVEVNPSGILATQEDSVIYRHDGTLLDQRYMWMDANNLHFIGGTDAAPTGDTTVIHDNGSISIGRSTVRQNTSGVGLPTEVKLDVEGDIFVRRVHSSSDRRFKKNITAIDNALDKVMQIDGVTWNWRQEDFPSRGFSSEEQVGFIAQNIEKVLPQVVMTATDGYKSVDYAKVTALLTQAIKEQQAQIESQQQIIASQQASMNDMGQQLADIKDMITELTTGNHQNVSNQAITED